MAEPILSDARSGIYQIRNKSNGKRYIGSAIRFDKRWREHRRDLRNGRHHSVALQRAWNKYGEYLFVFEVIELCSKEDLLKFEQKHIELSGDYNICRVAGSSLGIRHSEESRKRMKEAQARIRSKEGWVSPTKGVKYSREVCERMAAPKRGRKKGPMSEETKAKLSYAKKGIVRNIGRQVSEETRQKIREANLGKTWSIEKRMAKSSIQEEVVRRILQLRIQKYTYNRISEVTGVGFVSVKRICMRERYDWVDPHIPALTTSVIGSGGWKQNRKKESDSGRLPGF